MHAYQMLDPALAARVNRLPKAELHFHLEGALRWRTIREPHPARHRPARGHRAEVDHAFT